MASGSAIIADRIFAVDVANGGRQTIMRSADANTGLQPCPPIWATRGMTRGALFVEKNEMTTRVRFVEDLPKGIPIEETLLECPASRLDGINQILVFSRAGATRLLFVASVNTDFRLLSVPFGTKDCSNAEDLLPSMGASDVALSPSGTTLAMRSRGPKPEAGPEDTPRRIWLKTTVAAGAAIACSNPPTGTEDYGPIWQGTKLVWTRQQTTPSNELIASVLMVADVVDNACKNERRLLPQAEGLQIAGQNCQIAPSGSAFAMWILLVSLRFKRRERT
jgi:hypothetical protein